MDYINYQTQLFSDSDVHSTTEQFNNWLAEKKNLLEVISSNMCTYYDGGKQVFMIYVLFILFPVSTND
ncbi:hypothetical protein A0256_20150 [Mucilaginibacter sp. PAMC 26640]|nr:hypothetical protein A0256_20150 [Mucilaginibacter sp. PAMC 26640]